MRAYSHFLPDDEDRTREIMDRFRESRPVAHVTQICPRAAL